MTERKSFEIKLDAEGVGSAKIATLSAVDHDGDTYAKGAFGKQKIMILPGHVWSPNPPLGKGETFEEGDHAFARFKLNLETVAGKEWHSALKFDMADGNPLTEWSYGFKVLESVDEVREGKSIRVLQHLEVFEVSPVIKGAGVDTGTVSVKGRSQFLTDAEAVLDFAERLAAERKAEGQPFRQAWLMQIKELKARLEHLLKDVTAVEAPGDPAEAEALLAAFTAIQAGQGRADQ